MKPIWPVPLNHPPLDANTAHVWAVTVDAESTNIDRCLSLLSSDELRRAKSFQVDGPRRQFIVTRAALRTLLGRYLGLLPDEVSIEADENNKPQLALQHACRQLQFNVAHSADVALIAFAIGDPVGVDVERLRIMRLAEPIAQRYFHPMESMWIASTTASQRDAAFLRCWTTKEAFLKAIGTGLNDRLNELYVPREISHVGMSIEMPTSDPNRTASCWVRQLDAGDDYLAAIAVAGPPRDVHCMSFMP